MWLCREVWRVCAVSFGVVVVVKIMKLWDRCEQHRGNKYSSAVTFHFRRSISLPPW